MPGEVAPTALREVDPAVRALKGGDGAVTRQELETNAAAHQRGIVDFFHAAPFGVEAASRVALVDRGSSRGTHQVFLLESAVEFEVSSSGVATEVRSSCG